MLHFYLTVYVLRDGLPLRDCKILNKGCCKCVSIVGDLNYKNDIQLRQFLI